jgi:hypothetical protein
LKKQLKVRYNINCSYIAVLSYIKIKMNVKNLQNKNARSVILLASEFNNGGTNK